jgi:hypothetical protein
MINDPGLDHVHVYNDTVRQQISGLRCADNPIHGIDDSQILRPPNMQSDEAFAEFLKTKECPICYMVPRRPASIDHCGHEGCFSCLMLAKICPIGRCGPSYELIDYDCWPHRAKVSFDQDLLVNCNKCDKFKSGTVKQLVKHETYECPARIIKCPAGFCHVRATPSNILLHVQTRYNIEARIPYLSRKRKHDSMVATREDKRSCRTEPNAM